MKLQISWQRKAHLSYKETKTLISNRQKSTFIASIGGHNSQKDPLHRLSNHKQTTIFHLRTGIQSSLLCDCGKDDQTPNHFLQSCPLYNRERQHIWPVSTTMDAKLWGSANDLHLTTHFVTLTGQRIWHNQWNGKKLIISCVHQRARFGEQEFIPIHERLNNISAQELMQKRALWHINCYAETMNKTNIERYRRRNDKATF